jgi:pyridine nucleotide-disulfide oxidoreductase
MLSLILTKDKTSCYFETFDPAINTPAKKAPTIPKIVIIKRSGLLSLPIKLTILGTVFEPIIIVPKIRLGCERNSIGDIAIDSFGRTNIQGIYAAGDASCDCSCSINHRRC